MSHRRDPSLFNHREQVLGSFLPGRGIRPDGSGLPAEINARLDAAAQVPGLSRQPPALSRRPPGFSAPSPGARRRTPTPGQEGTQPVEVSARGLASAPRRLRHRGCSRVGRRQGRRRPRRRRHRDLRHVPSHRCQLTNHWAAPWLEPALTAAGPPGGRGQRVPAAPRRGMMTHEPLGPGHGGGASAGEGGSGRHPRGGLGRSGSWWPGWRFSESWSCNAHHLF